MNFVCLLWEERSQSESIVAVWQTESTVAAQILFPENLRRKFEKCLEAAVSLLSVCIFYIRGYIRGQVVTDLWRSLGDTRKHTLCIAHFVTQYDVATHIFGHKSKSVPFVYRVCCEEEDKVHTSPRTESWKQFLSLLWQFQYLTTRRFLASEIILSKFSTA